jgi:hypothetical protein
MAFFMASRSIEKSGLLVTKLEYPGGNQQKTCIHKAWGGYYYLITRIKDGLEYYIERPAAPTVITISSPEKPFLCSLERYTATAFLVSS